jgi:hypothetical protein
MHLRFLAPGFWTRSSDVFDVGAYLWCPEVPASELSPVRSFCHMLRSPGEFVLADPLELSICESPLSGRQTIIHAVLAFSSTGKLSLYGLRIYGSLQYCMSPMIVRTSTGQVAKSIHGLNTSIYLAYLHSNQSPTLPLCFVIDNGVML